MNQFNIILALPFIIIFLSFFIYLLSVKYPEISFVLFLTAGVYKADPRLRFLPGFIDLTVLFGVFAIIGVLYEIFVRRKTRLIVPSIPILLPYLGIVSISLLSLLYTRAPIYGSDKLLRFLTITSTAFLLPFYLFQDKKTVDRFFIIFIILGIAMFLDIISGGLKPGNLGFETAFGSNYLAVGRICGNALIILFLYFLPMSRKFWIKLLFITLLGISLFAMFISGGRGPLISVTVSIATIIISVVKASISGLLKKLAIRKVDFLILKTFVILLLISFLVFVTFKDYFQISIARLALLQEGLGVSVLERIARYKKSSEAIVAYPTFITGLGIGGFSVYYDGVDIRSYPHNIFLEIGSELGFLGLLFFVLIVYFTVKRAISTIRRVKTGSDYLLILTILALFINMLINSSVSGDINDNRLLFTWIGMVYSISILIKSEEFNVKKSLPHNNSSSTF